MRLVPQLLRRKLCRKRRKSFTGNRTPATKLWSLATVAVLRSLPVNAITVNYEDGALEFANQLFGFQPADEDLAWLAGALNGATVLVSVRRTKGWLYLTVNDHRFERYETSIRKDADGGLFAYIHHVYAAVGYSGQGNGARAFLRQVNAARRLGLKRCELFAAGNPGPTEENGYYVWARFGFDAPLREIERRALPDEIGDVRRINQVIQRDGHWWWKKVGNFRSMVFELNDESEMMTVFKTYLAEKGIKEESHGDLSDES